MPAASAGEGGATIAPAIEQALVDAPADPAQAGTLLTQGPIEEAVLDLLGGQRDGTRGCGQLSSAQTPAHGATLGEILATLEAAGFGAQMAARPSGMIMCLACRQESPAGEFRLEAMRRTEGASDPADMLAVMGLACPQCQARGTVVLGYGPESDPDDAEVVVRLGVLGT